MLQERMGKIMNLVARLHHKMEVETKEITRAQLFILKYLCDNSSRPVYQKEIEDNFVIRASTASEIINNLESKGFVVRKADKDDARKKQIVLTEKALQLNAKMYEYAKKEEKQVLSGITAEELKVLLGVLDKIEYNLNSMLGE